jgi:hypothetical protein
VLLALAVAQGLDAVVLFGLVDQIEVEGEGGGDGAGGDQVERGNFAGQGLGSASLASAAALGMGSDALLNLEKLGRLLGAEHPAEQLPEEMDRGGEVH